MSRNTEKLLKTVLGSFYGGPSLSWDEDRAEFVIYSWGDAPVNMDELGRGRTVDDVIEDFIRRTEGKS